MQRWASDLWRYLCSTSRLSQDATLYLLAAIFSSVNSVAAGTTDYREWALLSLGPYAVASLSCYYLSHRSKLVGMSEKTVRMARMTVLALLGLLVVIVPLASELAWRATPGTEAHAQPEVAVIERAGDRLAAGHNPYPRSPSNIGVPPSSDSHRIDDSSFFPYLPGMAVFGLLNATSLPPELGDARVLFVLIALTAFFVALRLTRAPPDRKVRAIQFFAVLPTGALPMVTGGDDLPVIALILLSLALMSRNKPLVAGLVAAAACSLKLTAWPIAALAVVATRFDDEDRSAFYYLMGLSAIVPVMIFGAYGNFHGFIENVVRFPLGLTTVRSPAASPLIGQFLVSVFPRDRRLLTFALAIVGLLIVIVTFFTWRPRTVVSATWFAGFALCVATVLAPATRFGYLIYPVTLFVWSYVLSADPGGKATDRIALPTGAFVQEPAPSVQFSEPSPLADGLL